MLDTPSTQPVDDEPITDEDRRCVREGKAWFAQRGGKGIPMEEVLGDFGLTPEDFPLDAAEQGRGIYGREDRIWAPATAAPAGFKLR